MNTLEDGAPVIATAAATPPSGPSRRVSALTRRRFLTWSGVAAAGALATGGVALSWERLTRAAYETPLNPSSGVLVIVTLYGGNDGLNAVIPIADPRYASARAHLAYAPGEVLPLTDGLALNPGLTGLKSLYDNGSLAIVNGVGYPTPDRSHFVSMGIWQTGSPSESVPTGWLGRWLDLAPDPVKAVSLDPVLPPLLAGATTAGASLSRSALALPAGAAGTAVRGLARSSSDDGVWQAACARSIGELVTASDTLHDVVVEAQPSGDKGSSGLAEQLDLVASLVELGVPTRVYSVSLGGFDTHADERGRQQSLLTELDRALSGFAGRLGRTDRGSQVVTMVYSEFGRRVVANASQGTDHGTAGPMFLMGRGVVGGLHGQQPSLTDLDGGDLRSHVDFRDVYAATLDRVLGADPGAVLSGWSTSLDGLLS